MAGSINRATVLGHVGRDPEIRSTSGGDKVANLSIATTESWKDRNSGERKERTEWHRVTVWNQGLIGVVEQYVRKGSRLLVEGQIQTRKWQDQSGEDRYSTEIVLGPLNATLVLLDKKEEGGSPAGAGDYARASGRSASAGRHQAPADLDDEIPFR